ncbi:hypothetical protein EYZ01_14100 [Hafnia alvei]|uniref:hypothetical protein n=1 Tax=Hafnia alvei TaxID=569 RepID=UPI00103397EB|nr:hypothetical protein [Hafnia alvei]TBL38449.1 hypothetical protein EYZ01_14100 [Hafnia alvei]
MLDRWRVSSAEYAEFHINIVLAYEQGGSIAAALHPGLAPFSSPLRGFLHCVIQLKNNVPENTKRQKTKDIFYLFIFF